MERLDIQAERILSIQEEKRQQYLKERQVSRGLSTHSVSMSARFLSAGGSMLILAGQALIKLAGKPQADERGRKVFQEAI